MTSGGWQIGRLFGVPVLVARSWFAVAAVTTVLFAPAVSRAAPGIGALGYLVALGFAVLLLLSVLVHELAHAVVARATGLPPTQIVLNLWGGHTQFETESASPGRSALVAAVGPLSNLVLAVPAWLAIPLLDDGLTRLVVVAFAYTNGFVALFNAVPGLPLDGGRILEALVWRVSGDRSTGMIAAGWGGRLVAAAVGAWALAPVLGGNRPDLFVVVWAALIGTLLWGGASQAIRAGQVRRRAPGAVVSRLARPAVALPVQVSLAQALARAAASGSGVPGLGAGAGGAQVEVVLVAPDGAPVAVLDPVAVAQVPSERRDHVAAASVARAIDPRSVVDAGLGGEPLLAVLGRLPGEEFVVVDAGRVVGLLRAGDVAAVVLPARRRGAA